MGDMISLIYDKKILNAVNNIEKADNDIKGLSKATFLRDAWTPMVSNQVSLFVNYKDESFFPVDGDYSYLYADLLKPKYYDPTNISNLISVNDFNNDSFSQICPNNGFNYDYMFLNCRWNNSYGMMRGINYSKYIFPSKAISMRGMFYNSDLPNPLYIFGEEIRETNVKDTSYMFYSPVDWSRNEKKYVDVPTSFNNIYKKLDKVVNAAHMFDGLNFYGISPKRFGSVNLINITQWVPKNVVNASGFFANASISGTSQTYSTLQLDFSIFNNLLDCSYFFSNCDLYGSGYGYDIRYFRLCGDYNDQKHYISFPPKVQNIAYMFKNCYYSGYGNMFINIKIPNTVTNCEGLFETTSQTIQSNLCNLTLGNNVTTTARMFKNWGNFKTNTVYNSQRKMYFYTFNFSSVPDTLKNTAEMFYFTNFREEYEVTTSPVNRNFIFNGATETMSMFERSRNLFSNNRHINFYFPNAINCQRMFCRLNNQRDAYEDKAGNVFNCNFYFPNARNCVEMFKNFQFTNHSVSNLNYYFNFPNAQNCAEMFSGLNMFNYSSYNLNLIFNIPNANNYYKMFANAAFSNGYNTDVLSLDLNNIGQTNQPIDMSHMFEGATTDGSRSVAFFMNVNIFPKGPTNCDHMFWNIGLASNYAYTNLRLGKNVVSCKQMYSNNAIPLTTGLFFEEGIKNVAYFFEGVMPHFSPALTNLPNSVVNCMNFAHNSSYTIYSIKVPMNCVYGRYAYITNSSAYLMNINFMKNNIPMTAPDDMDLHYFVGSRSSSNYTNVFINKDDYRFNRLYTQINSTHGWFNNFYPTPNGLLMNIMDNGNRLWNQQYNLNVYTNYSGVED